MATAAPPPFLEEKVTLRGTEYTITELSIAEYDKITEKATVKRRVENDEGEGTTVESVDGQLQSRLMIERAVTPKPDLSKIGTRLYGALNRSVNRLHFDVDEEMKADKDAKDGTEEADSGNG